RANVNHKSLPVDGLPDAGHRDDTGTPLDPIARSSPKPTMSRRGSSRTRLQLLATTEIVRRDRSAADVERPPGTAGFDRRQTRRLPPPVLKATRSRILPIAIITGD